MCVRGGWLKNFFTLAVVAVKEEPFVGVDRALRLGNRVLLDRNPLVALEYIQGVDDSRTLLTEVAVTLCAEARCLRLPTTITTSHLKFMFFLIFLKRHLLTT